MKQKITFVGHLYVDDEGLNWQGATKLVRDVVEFDGHQYQVMLKVVTKIEVDEDE